MKQPLTLPELAALRQKFFKECTTKDSIDGTKIRIDMAPHDIFEWFKRAIIKLQDGK